MVNKIINYIKSPLVILYLAPIILLSESLFTGKVLFWGTPSLQFIPWRAYAYFALLHGEIPLWNSLNGMGTPLLANYQLAIFYPPSWILILFYKLGSTPWMAWGHTVLAVLHIIWAGVGMSRFIKRLGFEGELNQLISGLCFSLGGYFVARIGFFSILWTGAWIPWILLLTTNISIQKTDEEQKWVKYILLIGAISLQLLAGHAQLSWYTLILASTWVIICCWGRIKLIGICKVIFDLGLVYVISALVASIQLIPTIEFLFQSQRSAMVDYQTALSYSFWPWHFLTFLSPDFFGNPGLGVYTGYANYWEDAVYIGVLPFFLALLTITGLLNKNSINGYSRDNRKFIISFWLIVVIGIIFAFGLNTPVFPFLYNHIPTFNMFNAPSRFMVWVVFSLSALAGIGVNIWRVPKGKLLYCFRLLIGGCAGITIGACIAWFLLRNIEISYIKATAITGIWAVGSGIITLLKPEDCKLTKIIFWKWLVCIWISADLIIAGWFLNPLIDKTFYTNNKIENQINKQIDGSGRVYISLKDENKIKYNRFFRFDTFFPGEDINLLRTYLVPNLNILDNISSTNNFDPLLFSRYTNWMQYLEKIPVEKRLAGLQIMDVGAVEKVHPRYINIVSINAVPGSALYRFFPCIISVKNASDALNMTMNMIQDEKGLSKLVVESVPQPTSQNCEMLQNEMNVVSQTDQNIEININTPSEGWFFAANTFYPGWKAYLDSNPVSLYHGNYLFMAIKVPEGFHKIIFTYKPFSFFTGFIISGSILFLIFSFILWRGSKYIYFRE